LVAERETTLVVAFVGTDPVIAANWIDDADAFAHASEIRIAASGGGLSTLLRRLLSSR
jgi:hypothetical protein